VDNKGGMGAKGLGRLEPFGWRFVTPLFMGSALKPINSTLIASLLGGTQGAAAHSLAVLTVARVLIGIDTSAGYPSAMLLIRRRATLVGMVGPGGVLGGLSIAGTVTVAVGPPIGGVLVGVSGWQAAFLVNIPVAVTAFAMALCWIPRDDATATRPLSMSRRLRSN
jgi:MFS family permease